MKQKFTLPVLSFQREKKVGKEKAGNAATLLRHQRGHSPLWTPPHREAFLAAPQGGVHSRPCRPYRPFFSGDSRGFSSTRQAYCQEPQPGRLRTPRTAFTLIELLVSTYCLYPRKLV